MPSLMFVPPAFSEELKQTDIIALYSIDCARALIESILKLWKGAKLIDMHFRDLAIK